MGLLWWPVSEAKRSCMRALSATDPTGADALIHGHPHDWRRKTTLPGAYPITKKWVSRRDQCAGRGRNRINAAAPVFLPFRRKGMANDKSKRDFCDRDPSTRC
jgi:hypothetical protein